MTRTVRQQPALRLPILRCVVIEDEPGKVILRVVDQHNRGEECRLEFTPDEADAVARHFWSASTQANAMEVKGG